MLFNNGGNDELYISSADWMRRNLDLRIEVGTKILDPDLKERIKAILILQQKDNRKARIVDADQVNNYVQAGPNEKQIRSQIEIHDYLVRVENEMAIDI